MHSKLKPTQGEINRKKACVAASHTEYLQPAQQRHFVQFVIRKKMSVKVRQQALQLFSLLVPHFLAAKLHQSQLLKTRNVAMQSTSSLNSKLDCGMPGNSMSIRKNSADVVKRYLMVATQKHASLHSGSAFTQVQKDLHWIWQSLFERQLTPSTSNSQPCDFSTAR